MKKMYKQPQTEAMQVEPACIICVSQDGRVGVNTTPLDNAPLKIE